MAEFRYGRVRLEMASRTTPGTALSDLELRQLEGELRHELEDPMRMRGLARFLDATVFFSPEHLLELMMEKLSAGRIVVHREADIEIDPNAGLDPLTLARFAEQDDDEVDDEEHAVAIALVGEDDEPIAGARYKVTLPDGRVVEGRTGQDGRALFWGLARAGDCAVEFPDLDADAWESVGTDPLT